MEIMTVAEEGMMPERQHAWDAGADLKAAKTMEVEPGEAAMVPTGVRCAIPEGYVGLLFARSSLCRKNIAMANGVGVIDSGYAGEIMVPLVATDQVGSQVGRGERIAQLVVMPCMLPTFVQAEELPETERGDGGFGSTGVGVVAGNATAGEPECLDYDGVPIKPGDAERHKGCPGSYTHRKPDSWEKLKSDMANLAESPCVYLNHGDEPGMCSLCDAWNACDHDDGMAFALKDILARAKRLAGVADE